MTDPTNSKLRVEIANEQNRPFDEQRLVAAVELLLLDHEILAAEISIAIVDDPTIRTHNNRYLGHDYETDVISFQLEYDPDRSFLSGQLIVSADTAATVANELGVAMQDELLLYVVHGTLHLLGLDDKQPELAAEMRAAEREYLQRLGVNYQWPEDELS